MGLGNFRGGLILFWEGLGILGGGGLRFFQVGYFSGGRVDIFSGGVEIFWEGLRFFRK